MKSISSLNPSGLTVLLFFFLSFLTACKKEAPAEEITSPYSGTYQCVCIDTYTASGPTGYIVITDTSVKDIVVKPLGSSERLSINASGVFVRQDGTFSTEPYDKYGYFGSFSQDSIYTSRQTGQGIDHEDCSGKRN